ncbi:MAG: hypothetical protein JWM57_4118 [Phycisphaerales bacterium]|nr:hypothetical protein [Phycisphaerales bacterium]
MKTRSVFRIDLSVGAAKNLVAVSENTGVTQIAVTSNLVNWFAKQPDSLQNAILGIGPDAKQVDSTKLALQQMVKRDRPTR